MIPVVAGFLLLCVASLAVLIAAILYRPHTARDLLFLALCSLLAGAGAIAIVVSRDRRKSMTPPNVAPVAPPDMKITPTHGQLVAPLDEQIQVELWKRRHAS